MDARTDNEGSPELTDTLLLVDLPNVAIASNHGQSPYALARRALRLATLVGTAEGASHLAFADDDHPVSERYEGPAEFERWTRVRALLRSIGAPVFAVAGYSADDLLVALAVQAEARYRQVLVLSGDSDLVAAIGGRTDFLYACADFGRGNLRYSRIDQAGEASFWRSNRIVDSAARRFGVVPEQMDELRALGGARPARIFGSSMANRDERGPIIDPRTAAELLVRFGSLDRIYDNLAAIESAGLRERLLDRKSEVRRRLSELAVPRTRSAPPSLGGLLDAGGGRIDSLSWPDWTHWLDRPAAAPVEPRAPGASAAR